MGRRLGLRVLSGGLGFLVLIGYWGLRDRLGCDQRSTSGTSGHIAVDDRRFELRDLVLELSPAEDEAAGYYNLRGRPTEDEDCFFGLPAGLSFYGDVSDPPRNLAGLAGRSLPIAFSGDGDDRTFCTKSLNGYLAASGARLEVVSVAGDLVTARFSGRAVLHYEDGDSSSEPRRFEGELTARGYMLE